MSLIYELRVNYGVNTMLLVPITKNAVDQMIPIAIKAAKDAGMTKWAIGNGFSKPIKKGKVV